MNSHETVSRFHKFYESAIFRNIADSHATNTIRTEDIENKSTDYLQALIMDQIAYPAIMEFLKTSDELMEATITMESIDDLFGDFK